MYCKTLDKLGRAHCNFPSGNTGLHFGLLNFCCFQTCQQPSADIVDLLAMFWIPDEYAHSSLNEAGVLSLV